MGADGSNSAKTGHGAIWHANRSKLSLNANAIILNLVRKLLLLNDLRQFSSVQNLV
jgi:hypothetical protein